MEIRNRSNKFKQGDFIRKGLIACFLGGLFLSILSVNAAAMQPAGDELMDQPRQLYDENAVNPFGVLEFLHWNHAWNHYKYPCAKEVAKAAGLMNRAHVGWVRMDFLWSDIEPSQGSFDFTKYDAIVDMLNRRGIHILGILNYSTDWGSACGKWNCKPRDNKLFVDYAIEVIKRYKGKVRYWEVWNEPDSVTYWKEQDGLKSYCGLLKSVYIAAKKVDPHCKILNGGIANGLGSINHLYENGAKDYFDILNIHFFESPLHTGSIHAVKNYPKLAYKVMQRNGDGNKKIWITETGSPGVKRGKSTVNWWVGDNPDERQQAAWLKSVYTELLKDPHVEKVFWAFFRDTKEHWENGVDYFGLIRWDYSAKPAFKAYRDCYLKWKEAQRSR
jgi:hypothetical protein